MPYFPEIIIAVIILVILIIYSVNRLPGYKKSKAETVSEYHNLRVKSHRIQEKLHFYILNNDASKKQMETTSITYGEYLKKIRKNHVMYLSEKRYIKLRRSNNRVFIYKTKRMLAKQETELNNIETTLQKNIKEKSSAMQSY